MKERPSYGYRDPTYGWKLTAELGLGRGGETKPDMGERSGKIRVCIRALILFDIVYLNKMAEISCDVSKNRSFGPSFNF